MFLAIGGIICSNHPRLFSPFRLRVLVAGTAATRGARRLDHSPPPQPPPTSRHLIVAIPSVIRREGLLVLP